MQIKMNSTPVVMPHRMPNAQCTKYVPINEARNVRVQHRKRRNSFMGRVIWREFGGGVRCAG